MLNPYHALQKFNLKMNGRLKKKNSIYEMPLKFEAL
jgi:hypothetical protein